MSSVVTAANAHGIKQFFWYAGSYSGSAAFLKLLGYSFFLWFATVMPANGYERFGLVYAIQAGIMTLSIGGTLDGVVGLLREHRSDGDRSDHNATASRVFMLRALIGVVVAISALACFSARSKISIQALSWGLMSGLLLGYASFEAQLVRLWGEHASSRRFNFVAPLSGLVGGLAAFTVRRTWE